MKNFLFEQNVNHCGDIVFEKSIVGALKSCTPGEWVILENKKNNLKFLAFVNPFRTDGRVARIITTDLTQSVPEYIHKKISQAILWRKKLLPNQSARLFFGSSDGIPGLVIDRFENVLVIQYHMLGALAWRGPIATLVAKEFPDVTICESTKPEAGEEMIQLESNYPAVIKIKEQGIDYEINSEKFQKTGFYYDHRSNRKKLFNFYSERDLRPSKVLDLYSYLGAWGAPFHRYQQSSVTFVDQANLDEEFDSFFQRYGNEQGSKFVRSSTATFLEQCSDICDYDLIICDPPAFKKGQDKKKEAMLGYESLMKKIIPKLKKGSMLAFSSCTHGISHSDLDSSMGRISQKENRVMQLLDVGVQDADHPMSSLTDKSMYIKYLLYMCKE